MNQELTTGNTLGMQTVPKSFGEQMHFAEIVSQAKGMLPRAYEGNPANVLVAVQYGASLGIQPMAALQNIDMVQGKPTLSAKAVAALVRARGHRLYLEEDAKNLTVTCTIVRCDDPEHPFTATRDKAWAQQMGLLGKDNYKKQPLTMLMWRAITACANKACPELFLGIGGAYTADELADIPENTEPTKVEATVMDEDEQDVDDWGASKKELAKRVSNIMANAGVKTAEEGALVVAALTGDTSITKTIDVDEDDLRTWLDSEDMLTQRVQALLAQIHEQQQAEQEAAETPEAKEEA